MKCKDNCSHSLKTKLQSFKSFFYTFVAIFSIKNTFSSLLNHMKKFFLYVFFSSTSLLAQTQGNPVFEYDFNSCNLFEATNFGRPASLNSALKCSCGLGGQSLELNGGTILSLPQEVLQLFNRNFTIDFYFKLTPSILPVEIMSTQINCSLDSNFNLKYLPDTKELLLQFSENTSEYYEIRGAVKDGCWNRVTFTKSQLDYTLYINNEKVKTINANRTVPVAKGAILKFSGSGCLTPNVQAIKGDIDEISIYDRALSRQELLNDYFYPDVIITPDTTIFKGESVEIKVGESCFNDFTWSPTTSLDNPNNLDVISKPESTIKYTLLVNTNACAVSSDVTIFVLDRDDKVCSSLLFPTIFSPNGDGLNDEIGISNNFIVQDIFEYSIYDKWGGRVKSFSSKKDTWDGTLNGKAMPGGSYMYNIKYTCKDNEYTSSGAFMLLK